MSWHHPDLYLVLGLLTGLAAFLAILYEGMRKFRRRPVGLKKAKPLDGLLRDHPLPTERHVTDEIDESAHQVGKQAAERFNWLCESMTDAPPKEQASRVREHFGSLRRSAARGGPRSKR